MHPASAVLRSVRSASRCAETEQAQAEQRERARLGDRGDRPYGKSEGRVRGRIQIRGNGEKNNSVKFIERGVFCINHVNNTVDKRVGNPHTAESKTRIVAAVSKARDGAELTQGCVPEYLVQQGLSGEHGICPGRKCKIVRRVVATGEQGYAGSIEKLNVVKGSANIHASCARKEAAAVDLKRDSPRCHGISREHDCRHQCQDRLVFHHASRESLRTRRQQTHRTVQQGATHARRMPLSACRHSYACFGSFGVIRKRLSLAISERRGRGYQ